MQSNVRRMGTHGDAKNYYSTSELKFLGEDDGHFHCNYLSCRSIFIARGALYRRAAGPSGFISPMKVGGDVRFEAGSRRKGREERECLPVVFHGEREMHEKRGKDVIRQ